MKKTATTNKAPTVVAIGGHSLLDPALPPTVPNQIAVTARACLPLANLIQAGEQLVLTHGNGPQVGFIQLRSELASDKIHSVPLDAIVADTQGALGYMIQRALREELLRRGVESEVVTIVTEVEVDADDDAFEEPTKPIGKFYKREEAEQLRAERGWRIVNDANRGWRRVVPSPLPIRVLQLGTIQRLAETGATVVCCGGGGIPVCRDSEGRIQGIEAVIDKDRASALLAVGMGCKRLVITTGVDAVYKDYMTDRPVKLPRLLRGEVVALARDGQFPKGSMRPKMEAAVYFLERGGEEVFICHPDDLEPTLRGEAGTLITNG